MFAKNMNEKNVSLNPAHGEVYSIQHYVILYDYGVDNLAKVMIIK
jgi:hypothetical protein